MSGARIVTCAKPGCGCNVDRRRRGVVVYRGYTCGLEDSGVAPEIAVNRSDLLLALLTSQKDIGLRYAFGTFATGGWRVRGPKSLISISWIPGSFSRPRHGPPSRMFRFRRRRADLFLNVVGWCRSDEAARRPGGRPWPDRSQAGRSGGDIDLTGYADYRLPLRGLSVNLGINHLGKRPGSADNQLNVPERAIRSTSAAVIAFDRDADLHFSTLRECAGGHRFLWLPLQPSAQRSGRPAPLNPRDAIAPQNRSAQCASARICLVSGASGAVRLTASVSL